MMQLSVNMSQTLNRHTDLNKQVTDTMKLNSGERDCMVADDAQGRTASKGNTADFIDHSCLQMHSIKAQR